MSDIKEQSKETDKTPNKLNSWSLSVVLRLPEKKEKRKREDGWIGIQGLL